MELTSSPCLISNAYSAACNAAVPEFTATVYFEFTNDETDFSKSWTYFPPWLAEEVKAPFLRMDVTTEISYLPR